ncbi:MAG: hypothetical protein ACK5KN_12030 [Dysgonomonas sp.]|uniref:hypothetical protein n=1 Tax=Dysgonomonas sp. TaxID=1891233 RepID=UPI003A8714C0
MKYLYYALYLFDVKIAHVQDFYPPIITVTGTMAFLIGALCYSIVNVFEDGIEGHQYPYYSLIVALSVSLILYKILYDYYKKREAKLLKEMKHKPLWVKIISIVGSLCFIVLVVKLWMFEGMSDLYQFIKQQLFLK